MQLYGETLPEPGTFADKVQMLDAALTRKDSYEVARGWRNQKDWHESENWPFNSDAYYLSDGGYSRIVCDNSTFKLFLTSNSRDEVKKQWGYCKELIADVEAAIAKNFEVSHVEHD